MFQAKRVRGIKLEDIVVGHGTEASSGAQITVHYVGRLRRGDVFQDTHGESPLRFVIGERRVIPGLEKGVVGMRVGGKRRITVSPHLGYGEVGVPGVVPANAVLVFEVELLDVAAQPGS